MVVILCFLCTVTTNFEYELRCSTVGFDFSNGERCVPKSTDDSTLCGLAGFDASCQKVSFDISTGKPCTLNQTNTSGSCQEVMINSIFRHFFQLLCILISNFYSPLKNMSFSYDKVHSYSVRQSDFSRSASYQNFFYYPSTFFGTLLPFVLLSILNGFLIRTVRKSHKMRHTMTNSRQVTISNFYHEKY